MTRKDYVAIAGALRFAREYYLPLGALVTEEREIEGIMTAAQYIANAMQDDNPRFDREHFLKVVRGERELTSRPPRARGKPEPLDYSRPGCGVYSNK